MTKTHVALPSIARAAVMTAANKPLELREYPLSEPGDGEVLVRVDCCTICRSDLHTLTGRRSGPTPAILGHEVVGTVVALRGARRAVDGAEITLGDRITWTLHSACRDCRWCVDLGLPMKCERLKKFGHDACDAPPHLRGGFAEYAVIDRGASLVRLPDGLPDAVAAQANCAVATAIETCHVGAVAEGETVLVQGAGALGQYAAAYARRLGCERVLVADPSASRRQAALAMGATDAIDAGVADETFLDAISGLAPRGVDCVIEMAGVASTVSPGLRALRVGGRYIAAGCVYPGAKTDLNLSMVTRNRLSIHGVHNYQDQRLADAVGLLNDLHRERHDQTANMLSKPYPLDRINDAVQHALEGGAIRVAVTPHA